MRTLILLGAFLTLNTPQIQQEYLESYIACTFDYPVNAPDAHGYYKAQEFAENNHLGEDWNAVTGGDSDLGDPIYAIANGYISENKDYHSGWGKVVRIAHKLETGEMIESLYAHCDTILVPEGSWVKKGDQIATIGNADGIYLAHLHLELRDKIGMGLGPGYDTNTEGYLNPTKFIEAHR